MRRRAILAGIAVLATLIGTLLTAAPASAHGAMMIPGSRTYLCWKDGLTASGQIQPNNPACAAAVAQSGPNSLYNWFAVLRSDGAGRTRGFIPDGKLCSGNATVYDFSGFDLARNDWPVTHLTSGATIEFRYNKWAAHPGSFRTYITKDTWSPTRPLAWDDLEDQPFYTATQPPSVGSPGNADSYYYWNAQLPSGKSGRHIIYSVWQRSDSNETFYNCSDVVFDGGHGEVTGVGPGSGGDPGGGTPSPSPQPGGACTATAAVTGTWNGGYQGEVKVTNTGTSALNGWTLSWTFGGDDKIANLWNGTFTQSGQSVTVKNAGYNGSLAAGASATVGFTANASGSTATAPTPSCASP